MSSGDHLKISFWRLSRLQVVIRLQKVMMMTGFQGKTPWDMIQLLAIPVLIATATIAFNNSAQRNEAERSESQRIVETDRAQQEILQTYFHEFKELVLEWQLNVSNSDSPVRQIARSNTLAAIRQLDNTRERLLLQFLFELGLIQTIDPIVSLRGIELPDSNLNNVNFVGINLNEANLVDAELSDSILHNSILHKADLSNATLLSAELFNANLIKAKLDGADLSEANLTQSNLLRAKLNDAKLFNATMDGANLSYTELKGADLSHADLRSADLRGSDLTGANLSYSSFQGAKVTNLQLAQAKSLIGIRLPDGNTITTVDQENEFIQINRGGG